MELIAVVALFVDLVFGLTASPFVASVPSGGCGTLRDRLVFKWFVLYLHLSYLVD